MNEACKVWCEYDFGGNVTGNIGVYLTREKAIEAVYFGLKDHGFEYESLFIQGLVSLEQISI